VVHADIPVPEAVTFSGIHTLAGLEDKKTEAFEPTEAQTAETPSVPIPPPSQSEIAAMVLLRDFSAAFPPPIDLLTPSREFILVELGTTAVGFG